MVSLIAFIDLINLLYKVELENIFFHRTEQEVVKARKQEAIPILSQLLQKATELLKMSDSKQVTISEKLHQALKYMINNWQELYGYVNIGNVLIDNKIGFVSPVRRYEALDRCTAAANVI